MDGLQKMLSIPLDRPSEVMEEAEVSARSLKRYIGYLQAVGNDIVLRVFAFRKHKGKSLEITEVMRRITQENKVLLKNLYGGGMQGYQAVYEKKDKVISSYGYPITVFSAEYFDKWEESEVIPGIFCTIVNPDMLKDTPFKYCGYSPCVTDDIIGYLNAYIEHPSVEYFGKLHIKPTPALIRKAEKDKGFRSWLYRTKIHCHCGANTIIYAYENNVSIYDAKRICNELYHLARNVPELKGTKINRRRLLDYIAEKGISQRDYNDYLKALKKLGYDLADTKNIFPNDFMTMHDMRVAEYDIAVEKEDKQKRAWLYADFEKQARLAKPLEYKGAEYTALIPSHIGELKVEGTTLHHCVGRMGYDKQMAAGDIVIVFIRSLLAVDTPLITVEYSLKSKRIIQARGEYNRRPTDIEQAFVDEWEKRTSKVLQEVCQ